MPFFAAHLRGHAGALVLACLALILPVGCRKQQSRQAQAPASASATQARGQRVLTVAAASDLKFALDQIASTFQRGHPGIQLRITYGSSGNFYSQLRYKAPFDLFLSADVSYPDKLVAAGLGSRDSEFHYARGRIVVWVPNNSKLDLGAQGFAALLDPSVRKIAIANPAHAPYGRAAQAALQAHHLWERLGPKIILGENIAQTAQFVQTGAADAGIVALSLALAPAMKNAGHYWLVPPEDYPPLEQAGLVLPWCADRPAADAFRDFLTGPAGRAILKNYGFSPAARGTFLTRCARNP